MFKNNSTGFNGCHRSSRLLALLILTAGVPLLSAGADLKLASFFGDHMVLQRDRRICIWGTSDAGSMVQVSVGTQRVEASVGTNDTWQAWFEPVSAGGPYVITASSGAATVTVHDVLYGDLWLCSGQSNMQMPVKECVAAEQAAVAGFPHLRLCSVGKGWKAEPQASADIKWRTCTPASAANFSAVGYFFAAELMRDPAFAEVPVGVIDSSFGGTTCEGWIPQPALAAFDARDLHQSMFGIKPAMLYNAMIAPLGNSPIKGVLWYQGESNSGHPETYPRLLSTMIAEWRKQFATPQLPFIIVQLPDYAYQWDGFYWPWEREAQAQVVAATPATALVVGINTTDGFNLHPKQKREMGRRAALAVRHTVYHEDVVASGPVFKSTRAVGSSMEVTFANCAGGLSNSSPAALGGFMVAGHDGVYRFADALIDGSNVVLQCAQVPAPETVRYAWTGVPEATLVNQAGLPAAPFRTDNFPAANVEVQYEKVGRHLTTSAYELAIDGSGKITSLIVRGAQFLSNEPDAAGGSNIPAALGPRALPDIVSTGPDMLTCSDNDATLLLKFGERSMTWVFNNRGKDDVHFTLALAPAVGVTAALPAETMQLTRKNSTLEITGVDSVSDSENGKVLQVVVKSGGSRELEFKVIGK